MSQVEAIIDAAVLALKTINGPADFVTDLEDRVYKGYLEKRGEAKGKTYLEVVQDFGGQQVVSGTTGEVGSNSGLSYIVDLDLVIFASTNAPPETLNTAAWNLEEDIIKALTNNYRLPDAGGTELVHGVQWDNTEPVSVFAAPTGYSRFAVHVTARYSTTPYLAS